MEAIKTKNLVKHINDLAIGKIIWMPTTQEIDAVMVELMALEYRAKEFDKRETGAHVVQETVGNMSYLMCNNCGAMAGNKYCDHCGYRLIYPESGTDSET